MDLIRPGSLGDTLDAINERMFAGAAIPQSERRQAAAWIAGRQGLEGAYAGTFAPTPADYRNGAVLFCGERITSRAGTGHVLGEEACRALLALGTPSAAARAALDRATESMDRQLRDWQAQTGSRPGFYCCATCSAALWRHLAAGGLSQGKRRLADAMKMLKSGRTGDGRWKAYPFYYTLLILTELDLPEAVDELEYAAPRCERLLARAAGTGKYARRRRMLVEKVLGRC